MLNALLWLVSLGILTHQATSLLKNKLTAKDQKDLLELQIAGQKKALELQRDWMQADELRAEAMDLERRADAREILSAHDAAQLALASLLARKQQRAAVEQRWQTQRAIEAAGPPEARVTPEVLAPTSNMLTKALDEWSRLRPTSTAEAMGLDFRGIPEAALLAPSETH